MLPVAEICQPPAGHTDTPEQASLRLCLISALEGQDPLDQIRIGRDLIELMRDQLMGLASQVRNMAALEARKTMTPSQIVAGSGVTQATVSRLLTKGRTSK